MTVHDQQAFSAGGGDSFVGDFGTVQQAQAPTQNMSGQPLAEYVDPYAGYVDYFGFDQREKWYFPDGRQWIEFKKLNEGDRARFLRGTRSDVTVNQQSREARISLDQSKERKELLLAAITGWHIVRRDQRQGGRFTEVPFNDNRTPGGDLSKWIDAQDPSLLASLEKSIRKVNPWLMNEMTVEQIDKEIADLTELREAAERRDAEEKNSVGR